MRIKTEKRKKCEPHLLCVTSEVSLASLTAVQKDDNGRHGVDHLPGRQQVQVRPAVSTPVTVHPLQSQSLGGRPNFFQRIVSLSLVFGTDECDSSVVQVDCEEAVLCGKAWTVVASGRLPRLREGSGVEVGSRSPLPVQLKFHILATFNM